MWKLRAEIAGIKALNGLYGGIHATAYDAYFVHGVVRRRLQRRTTLNWLWLVYAITWMRDQWPRQKMVENLKKVFWLSRTKRSRRRCLTSAAADAVEVNDDEISIFEPNFGNTLFAKERKRNKLEPRSIKVAADYFASIGWEFQSLMNSTQTIYALDKEEEESD